MPLPEIPSPIDAAARRLTAEPLRRFYEFAELRDEHFAIGRTQADAINATNLELVAARGHLQKIREGQRTIRALSDQDVQLAEAQVAAQEETIRQLEERLSRQEEARAARSARSEPVLQILNRLESALNRTSGPIPAHKGPTEVRPQKGEDLAAAVERARRRVRELLADAKRVESAPYPSRVILEREIARIEELAERGRPDIAPAIDLADPVKWPQQRVTSVAPGEKVATFASIPDTFALMCWLHKDALIAALKREVAAVADDRSALDDSERAARLAQIRGDLLAAEREEEGLLRLAQKQGLLLPRRPDADLRAVFFLSDNAL